MTSEVGSHAAMWYEVGRHLGSPAVEAALDAAARLHTRLEDSLSEAQALELRRVGPFLLWNGQRLVPQRSEREPLQALASALARWEIESVAFSPGLARDEVFALLQLLGTPVEAATIWPGAAARLRDAGVRNIVVQTLPALTSAPRSAVLLRVHRQQAVRLYRRAVEARAEIEARAKQGTGVSLREARRVLQLTIDLLGENEAALLGLTGIKSLRLGSEIVPAHAVNVAILSLVLGRAAGLDRRALEGVGRAALLHDLGAAGGCDFAADAAAHGVQVATTLFTAVPDEPEACLVALELHQPASGRVAASSPETWETSFASRIVAIADAYDRLTGRVSRGLPRVNPDRALACLQGEGGARFDASLVALFVRRLGGFPPGTAVQLDTGDVGVVLRAHPTAFDRPVVRLLLDAEGRPYPGDPALDLAAPEAGAGRSIARSIDPESLGLDPVRLFLPSAG